MRKIIFPLFIFVLIATGFLYFQQRKLRSPSSINTDTAGIVHFEKNDLSDSENRKQIKKLILQSVDWNYFAGEDRLSVKYENFKVSQDDVISNLCLLYPYVVISLEAPNISYSGEHLEIQLQKPCTSKGNIAQLDFDLKLLVDRDIFNSVKADSEKLESQIRIKNWDTEIPDKWRVKYLAFHNTAQNQNFEITKYEILSLLGYSIEFQTTPRKQ